MQGSIKFYVATTAKKFNVATTFEVSTRFKVAAMCKVLPHSLLQLLENFNGCYNIRGYY